jgi:hypothetical protein
VTPELAGLLVRFSHQFVYYDKMMTLVTHFRLLPEEDSLDDADDDDIADPTVPGDLWFRLIG